MRARIALAVSAGVAAALLYAGQFVISRWSLQRTLTPWDRAALRFAMAGPLLLPIVLRHGMGGAAGIGWGRAIVLAIAAGAPFTLLVYTDAPEPPKGSIGEDDANVQALRPEVLLSARGIISCRRYRRVTSPVSIS